MAKRAPTTEQPFSPVKSGLLCAVLEPRPKRDVHPACSDSHCTIAVAPQVLPELPRSQDRARERGYALGCLTREKRVLLSEEAEAAVN